MPHGGLHDTDRYRTNLAVEERFRAIEDALRVLTQQGVRPEATATSTPGRASSGIARSDKGLGEVLPAVLPSPRLDYVDGLALIDRPPGPHTRYFGW
jgi:hypothetical protein